MIDIHCHLLPGLDDGPRDLDESLAMLRLAARDGVRTVVATPHFGGMFGEPAPELIRELVGRVNKRAADERLEVSVLPGCEARVAPELPEKLRAGEVLTLGDLGRYVLVEVEPSPVPLYAHHVQFHLRLAGLVPILSHAERVAAAPAGLDFVREWVRQGGLTQVNAESLAGSAGREARDAARRLLRHGLLHAIASDGHSAQGRVPLLTPCLKGFSWWKRRDALSEYCHFDLHRGP